MNSTTQAAQLIASTAGKFFACVFVKKDGTRRTMIARVGVRKGTTGAGLKFTPADYNLVVVWDAQKLTFRMINLDTLLSLRCGGIQWKSAEVEAAPAQTPAEEMAALETRSEDLRTRMESSESYGSRRFRGLNAQTYRHKLARIKERQIELRAQISQEEATR